MERLGPEKGLNGDGSSVSWKFLNWMNYIDVGWVEHSFGRVGVVVGVGVEQFG